MPYPRAPRNRYRRRPSRLTALGKAVVGTTAFAFLAIGWASQASRPGDSRDPDPRAAVEAVAAQAVSAPPRWPTPPDFGAFVAPESQPSPTPDLSSAPPAALAEPDPADASAAAPIFGPPAPGEPAAFVPTTATDSAAPAAGTHSPASPVSVRVTPPTTRARFEAARPGSSTAATARVASDQPTGRRRLAESIPAADLLRSGLVVESRAVAEAALSGTRFRVDYSLDEALTEKVFDILRQGRVERGVAIVIDPRSGRLLAYAATNANVLPVERAYPAASIVKVVTGAAMLEQRPDPGAWSCLYEGNKYRLSERRLDLPRRGNRASLEDAMASSNNQCFAQWAIHGLGEPRLRRMLERIGWTARPAVGHAEGRVSPVASRFDLGQLGSGLDGARVTPLHVATLASVLADGRLVAPRWIDRVVDADGQPIALTPADLPQRVVGAGTASRLRNLMVATTKRGTARRAFRSRRGAPVLGPVEVAGKTGNLNGRDPSGRYEWFFGVAPANDPQIGVVVLQVHGHLWWARSSELAANILREVFCEGSACRAGLASRFTEPPGRGSGAVFAAERE